MLTMVDVAWLRLGYVLSSLPHVHHLFFWQRTIAAVIRSALAKSESWVIYKRTKTRNLRLGLLPYYNNLHAEHLTSYTNMLQFIGYQYFTWCKILQFPPTHNLHTPHAATRHSTGGWYLDIGEQKSLLLRQIVLRPCGVKSTAYIQTDCEAAGWGV